VSKITKSHLSARHFKKNIEIKEKKKKINDPLDDI